MAKRKKVKKAVDANKETKTNKAKKAEDEERGTIADALMARHFCQGVEPAKISDLVAKQLNMKEKPASPWKRLAAAAKDGRFRFVPKEETGLRDKLKRKYLNAGLHRVEVVGSVEIHDLAFRTAQTLLDILCEHYQGPNRQEVHIGFAGGGALLEVARALSELLREPEANQDLPRRLVFHSIVAGWNVEQPEKDPNSFSAVLAENRATSDFDIRFVGLHAPGIVPVEMFASLRELPGIKDAFKAADQLDIIVTSAGRWECQHSSLWQLYSKYSEPTLQALQQAGCVGDLMWCPIGPGGQIHLQTNSVQSFTLLQIDELHRFISEKGKHVLLILGPCSICGEPKTEVFRTIAALAPSQRFVNHLVCDSRTARQLIRLASTPEDDMAVL